MGGGGVVFEPQLFPAPAGRRDPIANMLVLVAAIPTPSPWFTLTGSTVAVVCHSPFITGGNTKGGSSSG